MDVTYATLPARGLSLALPRRPQAVAHVRSRLRRDRSPLALLARAARRSPDRAAALEGDRVVTVAELHARVTLLAGALHARGIGGDSVVGLMSRDHCGFAQVALAVQWVDARLVVVDLGASADQLDDVARREGIDLLVHDAERRATVVRSKLDVPTLVSDGHGSGSVSGACDFAHPAPPRRRSR
jgi:acyl-CoA synthetase (AMP-forming)/AMP-acid ligase II